MPATVSTSQTPVQEQTHSSASPNSVDVSQRTSKNAPNNQSASLYVGDLSEHVVESHLYDYFNMIGPVATIRVCRDAQTRRSLQYAYVNYHSIEDAERALETLNYTPIQGKPCRIMWSQRDPSLRKIGTGNVFIKNLDQSIGNKELHDTFAAYGNILSCKVVTENGKSKGYGFVHFERFEDAESAISNINGMLLNDRIVYVGHYQSSKDRESKADAINNIFTNVFVKNLPSSYTDEKLLELFSKYGKVTSALISRDPSGKSKEFGFVNYELHDDALKAIEALNDFEIEERKLYVGRAQKKAEREKELRKQFEQIREERTVKSPQGTNLYVKNLDPSIDEDKLKAAFSPFGTIVSQRIMVDEKNVSKGFGFISFSNAEEAEKALKSMNGVMLDSKPLYVSFAQTKDERKALLEAQRNSRMTANMYGNQAVYYTNGQVYPGQNIMIPPTRWNNGPGVANQMPYQAYAQPRVQRPIAMPSTRQTIVVPQNPISTSTTPKPAFVGNGLSTAALASASPEEQKQMIGEQLFPLIQVYSSDHAGKVTGMLLEMDNDELLHLIDSPEALELKVIEAMSVLRGSHA